MFIEWVINLNGTQYKIHFQHLEYWNKAIYQLTVNNKTVFEHKYNLIGPPLPLSIPISLNGQTGLIFVKKGRQHLTAEFYFDENLIPTSDATPGWETGSPF